ncbi:MAG TPA: allantoate amidohydrolase [Bryobacteraceae bacterium]|nr:allantoate amidohydrolase [Bryobacteraceae bacterium]
MSDVIARCRLLAELSEEPGFTTRTFLSPPMRQVHAHLRAWMERAGMSVEIDHAGNLRGLYPSAQPDAPRLFIGSHLDTVPRAGAFDGILGVVLAVALIENLDGRRLPFAIEVIGFSEEEGVRFGIPFIGSRAFIGDIDDQLLAKMAGAIAAFGLDPNRIGEAQVGDHSLGYLEFHIEQGPVLEDLNLPLGVVEAIAGQSRRDVLFEGKANHAGTTPMNLRQDALAGAAEWTGTVEREARAVPGAVATVGRLVVSPNASNVIAASVTASLDVRHVDDTVRHELVARLLRSADQIAAGRCLKVSSEQRLDQPALRMDAALTEILEHAVAAAGRPVHRMASGAGHDAMIVARRMPAAMLFLRSPGGISHHPAENVIAGDVAAALDVGMRFLEELERRHA